MTTGRSTPRPAWMAATGALGVLLALVLWRGAGAVGELRAALRHPGEPTPSVSVRRPLQGAVGRRLDGGGTSALAGTGRGLLLLFGPDCRPGSANMWNWIDLAAALDERPERIVAATLEGSAGAEGYWGALGRRVEVVAVDSATLRDRVRVDATPTTLLVEDGAVRRVYAGPLNALAKQEILEWLGPAPRSGGRAGGGGAPSPRPQSHPLTTEVP